MSWLSSLANALVDPEYYERQRKLQEAERLARVADEAARTMDELNRTQGSTLKTCGIALAVLGIGSAVLYPDKEGFALGVVSILVAGGCFVFKSCMEAQATALRGSAAMTRAIIRDQ